MRFFYEGTIYDAEMLDGKLTVVEHLPGHAFKIPINLYELPAKLYARILDCYGSTNDGSKRVPETPQQPEACDNRDGTGRH